MGSRPWWLWAGASTYLITFVVTVYLTIFGPAELRGVILSFGSGAATVTSVIADTPTSRGGVRAGDVLLSIDDQPIRFPRDWVEATGNTRADQPQKWLVARGDERIPLEVQPDTPTIRSRVVEGYLPYLTLLVSATTLGLLILWKRPNDAVGRLGAWFMLTAGIAFGFPWGWAVVWRALPAAVQAVLWFPQLCRFVLEGILLSFFLVFPQRLVRRLWIWPLLWAPVLVTLPWRVIAFNGVIHPAQGGLVPAWILQLAFVRTIIYLVAAIAILGVSYRRLLSLNERRRVRVLMLGTAVSAAAAIRLTWVDSFLGRPGVRGTPYFLMAAFPLIAACPLSLAYAILRHRVLDISVIVRQGLQYVLARGAVAALVPAFGALFALDLFLNSQQPLAEIVRARGWFYAAAGALAGLTHWKRKEWLETIDRRFFRDRYDAQRVLLEVVEEVRTARDFRIVAPRVVEQLRAAFHSQFVSAMVRAPDDPSFRAAISVPTGHGPGSLDAETKIVGLLRLLGKPLETVPSEASFLERRLPSKEVEYLHHSGIDLLVPIAMTPGKTEALLALGLKRSEMPYTREDQEFLEGIAASLALLVEESPPGAPERVALRSGEFEECPTCGVCYESLSSVCKQDGSTLVHGNAPRVLGGRYRLDRRRGHGGMGTVYEATDAELERNVAVKLIREDWADRSEAITRFRREARVAAGFAHPNVVTVHDYGLESDTCAFLVMELLEGRTLRDEILQRRSLPPSRVVEILHGVCSGVEAAHRHQLIHRDLKPANIFLAFGRDGAEEVVKVLDFGIAKFLPAQSDEAPTRTRIETDRGVLVGTPGYMSPEQLLGETLTESWDVWALAVIAYECLSGKLPFDIGEADWQRAVIAGRFTPLSELGSDFHAGWDRFFERCFSSDSSRRPGSAAAFFQVLEQTFRAMGEG